jgi:hypothetical protein
MACAGCRERAATAATVAAAGLPAAAPPSCRTCIQARIALLWIVGVGGAGFAAIYWLIGFGPCGCAH